MSAAPFPPNPAPLSVQDSAMDHGRQQVESAPQPDHFRTIYEALPDPAGITRVSDGIYVEVNPAFCQLLGHSREQILGRTSTELHIWATDQERGKLMSTLQRDGKAENLPLKAQRNGQVIPGKMSARPVRIGEEDCLVFVFHDTSEETRIRDELLAKNAALDQAGRMAQLGYWVDERGEGLVFWSNVCYDIHGLPRGSALPRDYINTCVTPRWRNEMRRRIADCLLHHTPWSMDVEIQRPDGSVIWGRARGEPVVENGRVQRIRGVMQDIDEQKRAEQRLRQSEERFARIFQLLPYPMGISRRDDSVYLEVNPAWEAMFGYTRQEALGRSAMELGVLSPQDRAELIDAAQRSQLLESYELQVTLRSGERRTCLQSMRATEFDGQPCWLFALQDITDRKHQEEEVREREALLSLTLTTAALGRWDWNLHTGMIVGDERWRGMHGLATGTMKGPAFLWTEPLGPEEVLRVTTEVTRHVAQPETPFDTTFCIRKPHEKERWIRNLGKVVSIDTEGQPERMLGISLDVTTQHEQESLLRRLAHYDTLTGLPNRVMLARRLADAMDQAQATGSLLGVAYLDLDGFKPVNDRLGHDAGDRLLVVAAQRMVRSLRPQDCVARLGGDEFAILLPQVQSVQECRQLLQQAMQSIASPYQLGKHRVGVTASIGYTLFPQDDSDADTLLRHADQAMYAAKQAGRNRLHEFDSSQERQSRKVREQIQRLREALLRGEFELFLQPKVDMHQGTVVGAEALARWRHPQQGVLAPVAFLPQLEGTELEVPFGAWVLQAGLQLARALQAQGLPLPVSVNVSAPHLQQPGFARWVAAELARHSDVPPGLLEIEITETAALYHIEPVAQTLADLRQQGVGVALDDFGTGYSSLTYLRRLPLSTLKIDQSFVHGMMDDAGDLAIVQGVIGLARSFGYRVIAEGVETVDQGQMLAQMGCHLAQGYHIARPMPLADFMAWSRSWQCPPEWRR